MIIQADSRYIPLADESVHCVVLDPFVGSGTTVKVAQDLGRVGIGLDLKWDYLLMAKRSSAQQGLKLGVKGEADAS